MLSRCFDVDPFIHSFILSCGDGGVYFICTQICSLKVMILINVYDRLLICLISPSVNLPSPQTLMARLLVGPSIPKVFLN